MTEFDMRAWAGRTDEADGEGAKRWHQMVKPIREATEPGVVLIGFACDVGVVRGGGRAGAKDGPHAVRCALAELAWYQQWPVYDWGDIRCDDDDMESAQRRLTEAVEKLITDGHRPLIIGGGCEASLGTYRGVVAVRGKYVVGSMNFDAHLDLGSDDPPNSGTTFAQIEEFCRQRQRLFKYFALGLAKPANTAAQSERATLFNVTALHDFDLTPWGVNTVSENFILPFVQPCGAVHLSVDLDVLPGYVMPAVSAPAARGIALETLEPLLVRTVSTGRVAAVDLVGFAPNLDHNGNAAAVAARLAWSIAISWRPGRKIP